MRIDEIKIQNFKGFKEQSFSFNSHMTVLIGDNGSGKSSILDALSFVLGTFFLGIDGVPSRALKEYEKRQVMVAPESIEVQLPFRIDVQHSLADEQYDWFRDTDKRKGGATSYRHANQLINQAKLYTQQVREGVDISLPLIAYYGTERLAREKYEHLSYRKKGSRLSGYYNALDSSCIFKKSLEWFKTLEDSILKFKMDDTLYKAFTEVITSMVPSWTQIRFSWEADDMLGQLDRGAWVSFRMMSDGYQNIIRLAADIAYRAIILNPHLGAEAVRETEGVVLIDEIDMHLHPSWQKTIIADLKRTFPKIQFIVTTHSPFIVQSLRSEELINLDGSTGENPFVKSIEEIAATEMQVENVRRSEAFNTLQTLAATYFDLVEQGKTVSDDIEMCRIKAELDTIELEFSEDPVYIALMQAERQTELR